LTQTSGRAARNLNGRVIMYADKITKSMQRTIEETERRREIQIKYNQEHNKKPEALNKKITVIHTKAEQFELNPYEQKPLHIVAAEQKEKYGKMSEEEKNEKLNELQKLMESAAQKLDFIEAAKYRDMIKELKELSNL